MKTKLFIFMLIACALGTVSCASKKVANQQPPYPNYAGQPQQPYYGQPQQPYYGQPQQPYYGQPQAPQQQGPDADGFEVKKISPVSAAAGNPLSGEIRGYGQYISPNESDAINKAKSLARGDIQAQVETFVKYAVNIYNQTTTAGSQQQFDQVGRDDLITLAKGVVQAVLVMEPYVMYNKQTKQYKVEVCMKYDKAGIIGALEEQGQRILKNREKFLEDMKDVWDEYDRSQGRKTQAELENEENLRIEASKNAMEQENLDRQNAREIDKINAHGQNIANIEAQRNQPANAPAIYYYSVNGTQYGPVNIHQLGGLAKNGQITIYTSIWREGLAAWTPAGQLPELRTIFASAPGSIPPPPPAY
ncbi:MAG: DUF4339 domain-containing protein [Paludibacteraceae bacterium]|nr:DUF4339 domain-containing protein [Paludibacteraceae bacterium]